MYFNTHEILHIFSLTFIVRNKKQFKFIIGIYMKVVSAEDYKKLFDEHQKTLEQNKNLQMQIRMLQTQIGINHEPEWTGHAPNIGMHPHGDHGIMSMRSANNDRESWMHAPLGVSTPHVDGARQSRALPSQQHAWIGNYPTVNGIGSQNPEEEATYAYKSKQQQCDFYSNGGSTKS